MPTNDLQSVLHKFGQLLEKSNGYQIFREFVETIRRPCQMRDARVERELTRERLCRCIGPCNVHGGAKRELLIAPVDIVRRAINLFIQTRGLNIELVGLR
jgi:hypothetical protein